MMSVPLYTRINYVALTSQYPLQALDYCIWHLYCHLQPFNADYYATVLTGDCIMLFTGRCVTVLWFI